MTATDYLDLFASVLTLSRDLYGAVFVFGVGYSLVRLTVRLFRGARS